jgi:CDP-diacylglycerol--serine O-phosphatidyltransferase
MNMPSSELPKNPSILSFTKDLPNICSFVGLLSALLGIYFAVLGNFSAAMIGFIWAVFFDWSDGIIARRMKGRSEGQKAFGGQLDSLIDLVSFGVGPAIVLLSYGKFSPWFLPGAFIIVAAIAMRLSYFNVFGLVDKSTYLGLAADNNMMILALVFLLNGHISQTAFTIVLYILIVVLAFLNVAPVRTPKLEGRWYYVLIVYTLVLTVLYMRQLL